MPLDRAGRRSGYETADISQEHDKPEKRQVVRSSTVAAETCLGDSPLDLDDEWTDHPAAPDARPGKAGELAAAAHAVANGESGPGEDLRGTGTVALKPVVVSENEDIAGRELAGDSVRGRLFRTPPTQNTRQTTGQRDAEEKQDYARQPSYDGSSCHVLEGFDTGNATRVRPRRKLLAEPAYRGLRESSWLNRPATIPSITPT